MGFIKFIYNFLLIVAISVIVPVWWYIYKKKGYDIGLRDRLFPKRLDIPAGAVWIHCVSVGEIKTAMPIIEYISSKHPVFLTVFSPRAYKFAKDTLNVPVTFLPFDLSFLIAKFIKLNRPKILILMEGELWFNLVMVSSESIPVISINTHVPKIKLYKHILNRVSQFILKSKEDEEKLKYMGVNSYITLCGNLKILSKVNQQNISFNTDKKVILAGSTHPPEEEIIFDTFKQIKQENPNLLLVIAPRHIERVKEIIQLAKEMGFSYSLRTKTTSPQTDIYIIDTIGELSSFYRFADVVFVGGTLSKVGGHNIFEPILNGKKVIIGDNYQKIRELVEEAKKLEAIYIVKNKLELKETIQKLLENPNINENISELQDSIIHCYKKTLNRWL